MDYSEFMRELVSLMQKQAGEGVRLTLVNTRKINGNQRQGICFEGLHGLCAPTVYPEPFYERFRQGMTLEETAEELWTCCREELSQMEAYVGKCAEGMDRFETAAPRLFARVFHRGRNAALLSEVPHRPCLDLALAACYEAQSPEGRRGSVLIRREHMEHWGVDADRILDRAATNSAAAGRIIWQSMEEILAGREMVCFPQSPSMDRYGMYVMSNADRAWGAASVFLPGVAAKICEVFGEEFYVLPCSVHEVLLLPASRARSRVVLERIVREVNREEIPEEDFLSDSVYHYDHGRDRLEAVCVN